MAVLLMLTLPLTKKSSGFAGDFFKLDRAKVGFTFARYV
jgi:hypothetical protein